MAKRDYYDVLGISRNASDDEIKKAYRRLAKKFHPDANRADPNATEKFKEIQEAYSVIGDAESRAKYDQFGHDGFQNVNAGHAGGPGTSRVYTWTSNGRPGAEVDLGDLADLFEMGGRGSRGGGSIFEELFQRGRHAEPETEHTSAARDIVQDATIPFDFAVRGGTIDVRLPAANGQTISVKIPPGVDDGQRIRVRGKGRPGRRGQTPGDLFIVCRVEPHRYFRRMGNDIYLEVPLTIAEATLGASVDLPTIDGQTSVKIPPGTASGAKLRLAARGIQDRQSAKRGDQYCVIKIVPPRHPTEKQVQLMTQFAAESPHNPREGLW